MAVSRAVGGGGVDRLERWSSFLAVHRYYGSTWMGLAVDMCLGFDDNPRMTPSCIP